MINSIELKNWKTHSETKLRFSKGTNILLGQMGTGKSSIMDAISFALFGTYPAIQHRKVAVDGIIMNRPEQKNQAKVRLDFGVDGISYTVERTLELNGAAKATISKEGTCIQTQPQRVNEEIAKILKVDYDLFSRAVYSEQNRLTYFLELRPAERKKQIDELLGLDKFATAQDNATTLVNKIRDMVSEGESTAATFDITKLKEQHKTLLDEAANLAKTGKDLSAELNEHNKKKIDVEKGLKEAKELYNKKVQAQKEIEGLTSRLGVIEKEIEKIERKGIKDKAELTKSLKEATALFDNLHEEEKKAEGEEKASFEILAHAEAEMGSVAKDAEEEEKLLKQCEKRDRKAIEESVTKKTEETKKLKAEHDASVASRKENQKWLDELKAHLDKCPICERELDEKLRNKILEDRNGVIEKLRKEIEKQKIAADLAEKELEECKKEAEELNRIEDKLKCYKDAGKKLKAIKGKAESARTKNAQLKKKKEDAKDVSSKAKDALAKLDSEKETIERLEGYVSDRSKTKEALKVKEQEAIRLPVNEEAVEKLQNAFTTINVSISEIATRMESNATAGKEKAVQATEKKKEIENIEKILEGVKKKKKAIDNLNKFKIALEETQAVLRTKLIGSINGLMQEIWPELYPYGDYQNIMLEPDADDYALKVNTNRGSDANWENVDMIASGGEKSIACLAMRVAFALVLVPNLKWIILDEPTHNLDQQGLDKFVKAINETLPRIVDQVFIITHDDMLKQAANAKIYVLSRNKEVNGGTSVEAF